jgi:hypothetical protein
MQKGCFSHAERVFSAPQKSRNFPSEQEKLSLSELFENEERLTPPNLREGICHLITKKAMAKVAQSSIKAASIH